MEWIHDSVKKAKEAGAKKVFVQVPECLKTQLLDIGKAMDKAGIEAVLSCEPCYGACDLRDAEAKRLGCELLLHIGHADMGVKTAIPVIYEEYPIEADAEGLLRKNLSGLKGYGKIGLFTTVQHIQLIGSVKKLLESEGRTVLVGKPNKAKYPGQLLGCDQSAAKSVEGKADAFLFMGSGVFHPLGLAMATDKPVLFIDFESGKLVDMSQEKARFERIRFANVEKAKDCKNFGILISTKPGQSSYSAAREAKRKLEMKGRHAWILAMDTITPDKLLGLKLDCLVNCSCPRLRDDASQLKRPVIGPEDIEKLQQITAS